MIETTLALLGPKILGIMALVIAGIGLAFQQRLAGAKAERNKLAAKERDSYAKHIEDIERASAARASGSVSDDPYNRG